MNSEEFLCSECGKSYATLKKYNRHLKLHSSEPCECGICGLPFPSEASKKDHERRTHSEKEKCEFCPFFGGNMQRHVKEMHSGCSHQCSKCDKRFKRLSTLKSHEPKCGQSKKKKSHECVQCGKCFTRKQGP